MTSLNLPDSNWTPTKGDRVQLRTARGTEGAGTVEEVYDIGTIEVVWDENPAEFVRYPDKRNLKPAETL